MSEPGEPPNKSADDEHHCDEPRIVTAGNVVVMDPSWDDAAVEQAFERFRFDIAELVVSTLSTAPPAPPATIAPASESD